MLEDVWHDIRHQNQHGGGAAASCAAGQKRGVATVLESACPRDCLQRYGQGLGLPTFSLGAYACVSVDRAFSTGESWPGWGPWVGADVSLSHPSQHCPIPLTLVLRSLQVLSGL